MKTSKKKVCNGFTHFKIKKIVLCVDLSASKCVTILQKEENKVGNWKIFMLYHAHLVTAQSMAN